MTDTAAPTDLAITDFEVGCKVASQPHTDQFMRGLRFGRVVKVGHTYVHVAFHNDTRAARLMVPHMLRITAPAHCTTVYAAPGHVHDGLRCVLGWDHAQPCVFGTHRADVEPITEPDLRPAAHLQHQHMYVDKVADWWCMTCANVTDFCTENSPR